MIIGYDQLMHQSWRLERFSVFLVAISFLLTGNGALAAELKGVLAQAYEIQGARDRVIFTIEQNFGVDGLSSQSFFRAPDGQMLATEKMEFDAAGAPLRYTVDHTQTGSSGVVEVSDGKLRFTLRTPEGKVRHADEKLPEIWATGPMFIPVVRKHWERLARGESLRFRFAVWDRAETVGFELFKVRVEKKTDGHEVVVLKLKPSSFIVAAIVDPLFFEMRPDGSALETVSGRTLPKRQVGSEFRDLDAYIVYRQKP
ncbi:MAG: hypothetical protein RJB38_431 [Pseudomonadota bacterium]